MEGTVSCVEAACPICNLGESKKETGGEGRGKERREMSHNIQAQLTGCYSWIALESVTGAQIKCGGRWVTDIAASERNGSIFIVELEAIPEA